MRFTREQRNEVLTAISRASGCTDKNELISAAIEFTARVANCTRSEAFAIFFGKTLRSVIEENDAIFQLATQITCGKQ